MANDLRDGLFQVISFRDSHSSGGRVQKYRPRKTHRKSGKGCRVCKQRRVKVSAIEYPHPTIPQFSHPSSLARTLKGIQCDEQVPVCENCLRRGERCLYAAGVAPVAPHISQEVRTVVHTDWCPDMDSRLFNYFVGVVVETMLPLSSWTTASQTVVRIALHVSDIL